MTLLQADGWGQKAWRDDTGMAVWLTLQRVFQHGWTKGCHMENETFQQLLFLENVGVKLNLRLKKMPLN